MPRRLTRPQIVETMIAIALFVAGGAMAYTALRAYRAAGVQPSFYQGNFEPAVMMACGLGFATTTATASPNDLQEFLKLTRNTFDCSTLPASIPLLPVSWNGTWYYLYATTAAIWRVTGISWTALDDLVAAFGAVVAAALYGLFRLVAPRWLSAGIALLLAASPANLGYVLYLRDYSKAPFVLVAVLILGVLVARPRRRAATIGLSALFGAVVGFGYGFRSDLMIMVPFGLGIVALLLPGVWRANIARNTAATVALLAAFLIVAWPPLRGLKTGGCQFHYSLLGLTTPLTRELGMEPATYNWGDHFTDTFIDQKVGDYAQRILALPAPNLCAPDYDVASGQLFRRMALTFPADLVAHAYAAVLAILRAGLLLPPAPPLQASGLAGRGYQVFSTLSDGLDGFGPLVTLLAVAAAWTVSMRLGIAVAAFVLFLCGYPSIEFEARHWFHLRFIPWWAAALVAGRIAHFVAHGWPRARLVEAVAGVAVVLVLLAAALAALRAAQTRTVSALIASYQTAPVEDVAVERADASALSVLWRPLDFGGTPNHRSSDLIVVTLDSVACAGSGDLTVRVRYEADAASHDLSSTIAVRRPPPGAAATRLFVPVFSQGFQEHTYMRFAGLQIAGAPTECMGRVARVTARSLLPLWLEIQIPEHWREAPLYQTIRLPRMLRR